MEEAGCEPIRLDRPDICAWLREVVGGDHQIEAVERGKLREIGERAALAPAPNAIAACERRRHHSDPRPPWLCWPPFCADPVALLDLLDFPPPPERLSSLNACST